MDKKAAANFPCGAISPLHPHLAPPPVPSLPPAAGASMGKEGLLCVTGTRKAISGHMSVSTESLLWLYFTCSPPSMEAVHMFSFSTRGQDLWPAPPSYAAAVCDSGLACPWLGHHVGMMAIQKATGTDIQVPLPG